MSSAASLPRSSYMGEFEALEKGIGSAMFSISVGTGTQT